MVDHGKSPPPLEGQVDPVPGPEGRKIRLGSSLIIFKDLILLIMDRDLGVVL